MNEILEAAKNQLEEKYNIIQKLYDSRKSELKQPYSDADQELINELHGANGVLRFFYHKLRIIKSQKFKAEVEQRVNNELFEKWVNAEVQHELDIILSEKTEDTTRHDLSDRKTRIIKSQKFKEEVEQRVNNELFEKWVNVAVQERIGFFSPKKNDENIKFSIYKDMAYDPNYC
jgi:hypothetical protein